MKVLSIFAALLASCYPMHPQSTDCKTIYKLDGKESAYPRLSQDDRSILYQSNKDGPWQLYVMDRATGIHTRLSKGGNNDYFADWSPDNHWIVFVSDRDGNEELYLMQPDGSSLRRLTNDSSRDIHPYFSPDGKFILFNSTRGNGSLDVYRYNIASGKTEQLTNTAEENETCARYAPDMQHIVFLRNSAAQDDVYVLGLSNFLTENITRTPAVIDGWPMYSADGQWIYYSSMEDGRHSIFRIRPDGSGKVRITAAGPGEEDARVYVSQSGSSFIYNKRIGKTIEIRICLLR